MGGSTTVNWTSSFRTPPGTLEYWRKHFGLSGYSVDAMAPWFAMMEKRLHVSDWAAPPNENNDLLRRGATALGIPTAAIRRNVNGCWNLGYCGMGCPTNAKQSMLVTTIPSALALGAGLLVHARAERFSFKGERIDSLQVTALDAAGQAPTGVRLTLRAKHFVLAGGAINSPALLLRSQAPDPHGLLGRRTFLHPTVISAGLFPQRVDAYAGAPQTIYSDHFLHTAPIDGPIGYKLEAPPLHPLLMATTMGGFGDEHARTMREFPMRMACWPCCATAFTMIRRAARYRSTVSVRPCSTIRSRLLCGMACGARCCRWRKSSSPPARKVSIPCMKWPAITPVGRRRSRRSAICR